ncbi:MAG: hypothetical protein LBB05_00740 [Puniceicoccales bacterium]|nr:hypothetical protein [Puniceicoccales bacterium]
MADLVDMAAPRGNTFSGQAIFDLLSDDAKALLNLLSPVFPPNTLEWKSVLLFMLLKFSLLRYFFVEIDESNQCVYFCAKFPSPIGTLSPYEASTKTSTETTVKYVRAVFETCKSVKTITAYPASVNKISRGQAVRGGQRSYEAEIPW